MKKEDEEEAVEIDEQNEDESSEEEIEELLENDEITPEEEGFMIGASKEGQNAKCANCGKVLVEKEDVIEKQVGKTLRWFCCETCAKSYEKKEKDRKR